MSRIEPQPTPGPEPTPEQEPTPEPSAGTRTIRIAGDVPPEVWNRLGTKLLPKLRSGADLKVDVEFSVAVDANLAGSLSTDLRQILDDLGLTGRMRIDEGGLSS